jgi:cell division septal protein FtsQ
MALRGGASRFRVRVLPTVLLTAAILLLPALLYAWGRQADAFSVDRVTVAGGRSIPEKQALRLLRKEFLGRNLFTITTGDVRDTLDDLCYLAAVQVDKDFPTTLRVRLVEHRPAAYVLAKGRWFVVADSGHVICALGRSAVAASAVPAAAATASSTATPSAAPSGTPSSAAAPAPSVAPAAATTDPPDEGAPSPAAIAAALAAGPSKMKPVLPRMASAKPLRAGRTADDGAVRAGLRVLTGLPSSLRAKVKVVRVGAAGLVSLDLAGGLRVELGDDERLAAKVLALRAVLVAYQRAGTDVTFIDVSIPDRPLGRPRLSS